MPPARRNSNLNTIHTTQTMHNNHNSSPLQGPLTYTVSSLGSPRGLGATSDSGVLHNQNPAGTGASPPPASGHGLAFRVFPSARQHSSKETNSLAQPREGLCLTTFSTAPNQHAIAAGLGPTAAGATSSNNQPPHRGDPFLSFGGQPLASFASGSASSQTHSGPAMRFTAEAAAPNRAPGSSNMNKSNPQRFADLSTLNHPNRNSSNSHPSYTGVRGSPRATPQPAAEHQYWRVGEDLPSDASWNTGPRDGVTSMSLSTLAMLQQQLQTQQQQKENTTAPPQPVYVMLTAELMEALLQQQQRGDAPGLGQHSEGNPQQLAPGGGGGPTADPGAAQPLSVMPLSRLYNSSVPHNHPQQTAAWLSGNNAGRAGNAHASSPTGAGCRGAAGIPANQPLLGPTATATGLPAALWRGPSGGNTWGMSSNTERGSVIPPPPGPPRKRGSSSRQAQQLSTSLGPGAGYGGSTRNAFYTPPPSPGNGAGHMMFQAAAGPAFPAPAYGPGGFSYHIPGAAAGEIPPGPQPPMHMFPARGGGRGFTLQQQQQQQQQPQRQQPQRQQPPPSSGVISAVAPQPPSGLPHLDPTVAPPPVEAAATAAGPTAEAPQPSPSAAGSPQQGAAGAARSGAAPAHTPGEGPPPGSCANGSQFTVGAWYEGKIKRYNPQRGFGFITGLYQLLLDGSQCEETCTQYLSLPESSSHPLPQPSTQGSSRRMSGGGAEDDSSQSTLPHMVSSSLLLPTDCGSTTSNSGAPSLREVVGMPLEMQLPPKGTTVDGGVVVLSAMQWYLRLAEQEGRHQHVHSSASSTTSRSSGPSANANANANANASKPDSSREKSSSCGGADSDSSDGSVPPPGLLKFVKKPMPHIGDIFVHHSCISLDGLGILTPYTVVRFSVAVVMNTVQAVDVVPIGPSWRTWQEVLADDSRARGSIPGLPPSLASSALRGVGEAGCKPPSAITEGEKTHSSSSSAAHLRTMMPSCRISGHALLAIEQHRLQRDAEPPQAVASSAGGRRYHPDDSSRRPNVVSETDVIYDTRVRGSSLHPRHGGSSVTWKDVVVVPSAAIPNAIEGRSELCIVERSSGENVGVYSQDKLREAYQSSRAARRVIHSTTAVEDSRAQAAAAGAGEGDEGKKLAQEKASGSHNSGGSSSKQQDTEMNPLTSSSMQDGTGHHKSSADGSSRNTNTTGEKRSDEQTHTDDSHPMASEDGAPSGSGDDHQRSTAGAVGKMASAEECVAAGAVLHPDAAAGARGHVCAAGGAIRTDGVVGDVGRKSPQQPSCASPRRSGASTPTQFSKDGDGVGVRHQPFAAPQLSMPSSEPPQLGTGDGTAGQQPPPLQHSEDAAARQAAMGPRGQQAPVQIGAGGRLYYSLLSSPHQTRYSAELSRDPNQASGGEDYEEQATSTTTTSGSTLPESKVNNPVINADWTEMFDKKISQEKIKDALLHKTNMIYFPRQSAPPSAAVAAVEGGTNERKSKQPTAGGGGPTGVRHVEVRREPESSDNTNGPEAAGAGPDFPPHRVPGQHFPRQMRAVPRADGAAAAPVPGKPMETDSSSSRGVGHEEMLDHGLQPRSTSTDSPMDSGSGGNADDSNGMKGSGDKRGSQHKQHAAVGPDGVAAAVAGAAADTSNHNGTRARAAQATIKDLELVEVRQLPQSLRQQVPPGVFVIALPSAVVQSLHIPTMPLTKHRGGASLTPLHYPHRAPAGAGAAYQNSSDSSDEAVRAKQQRPPRGGISSTNPLYTTAHSASPPASTTNPATTLGQNHMRNSSPTGSAALSNPWEFRHLLHGATGMGEEESIQSSSWQEQHNLQFAFGSTTSSEHGFTLAGGSGLEQAPYEETDGKEALAHSQPRHRHRHRHRHISPSSFCSAEHHGETKEAHPVVLSGVGLHLADTTTTSSSIRLERTAAVPRHPGGSETEDSTSGGAPGAGGSEEVLSGKVSFPLPPWLQQKLEHKASK